MSVEKIIQDWKKKIFKPLYLLEGEEEYYIDKIVQYAEHSILTEAEAGFNLTIFYGRDANWRDVVNACSRYPMFADRQVVLLKEAQFMRDIDMLEKYAARPLASTIFIIAFKGEKKLDGRTKLRMALKQKAEIVTFKKIYESQLPAWTNDLVKEKGYSISEKAVFLLVDHIGNDLSRIENEIDKLLLNLAGRKTISEDDIEKYVGISKEYNVFELQDAFGKKDLAKAIRIIQYFEGNPKAAPIPLVFISLYTFFSKAYMTFAVLDKDKNEIASAIGANPYFIKDYLAAVKSYEFAGIERALLLLHSYNLKTVGINDSGSPDASLLKELAVKIIS